MTLLSVAMGMGMWMAMAAVFVIGGPAAAGMDCSDEAAVGRVPLLSGTGAPAPGSFANPWINRKHLFCGDINARGRAVGFHHRHKGRDPINRHNGRKRKAASIEGPLDFGVGPAGWRTYRGYDIYVWKNGSEKFVRKNGFSSFFPNNCTPAQVVSSVRYAYLNAQKEPPRNGGRFRGWSGPANATSTYCYRLEGRNKPRLGIRITGFLNDLRDGGWTINTAYPN